jgi:hypothetical protein
MEPPKKTAHELSRKRGLEGPFNSAFLGTVSAFLVLTATQYLLYVPCVHWVWYVAPSVLLAIAVPSWWFVALYNPVDPYCRANTQSMLDDVKYCNHCACYTSSHSRTRHCYDCHKCVVGARRARRAGALRARPEGAGAGPSRRSSRIALRPRAMWHALDWRLWNAGFDHHCVYLQTCIGKHNYPVFFTLISTVWLWCGLVAALDVFLAIPSSMGPFAQPLNQCALDSRCVAFGWRPARARGTPLPSRSRRACDCSCAWSTVAPPPPRSPFS